MPKVFPRVTIHQRAFLEQQGFPLEIVVGDVPLQPEGVTTLGWIDNHPWQSAGGSVSYSGSGAFFTYGYPNEEIAWAADAAREADWAETIGPEGERQLVEVRIAWAGTPTQ